MVVFIDYIWPPNCLFLNTRKMSEYHFVPENSYADIHIITVIVIVVVIVEILLMTVVITKSLRQFITRVQFKRSLNSWLFECAYGRRRV